MTIEISVNRSGALLLGTDAARPLQLLRLADGTLQIVGPGGSADDDNAGPIRLGFVNGDSDGDRTLVAGSETETLSWLAVTSNQTLAFRRDSHRSEEPARLLFQPAQRRVVMWRRGAVGIPVSLALDPATGVVGLLASKQAPGRHTADRQTLAWSSLAGAAVGIVAAVVALVMLGDGTAAVAQDPAGPPMAVSPAGPAAATPAAITSAVAPAEAGRSSPATPPTPTTASAAADGSSAPTPAPTSSAVVVPTPQAAAATVPTEPATATPTLAPSPAESITASLPEYVQAVRTGDGSYVLAHLHPIVASFYGQSTCQTFFANLGADPTFSIQPTRIDGPAPWTWAIYGETVGTVPDAFTVNVTLVQRGQTLQADVHFGWDGRLLVFSPCRRPPGQ